MTIYYIVNKIQHLYINHFMWLNLSANFGVTITFQLINLLNSLFD